MKPLLYLTLLLAWPAAGFSEMFNSIRGVRSVQRVATVRTSTAPSFEVYRTWDHNRDYRWDQRRYHWDGTSWIVVTSSRAGYGTSSTLQDDVGETNTPDEVYVGRRVVRDGAAGSTLTFDVQRQLARRGYYHGAIDGINGPGTRSALAAFEADNGLEPNGLMSREVVISLGL